MRFRRRVKLFPGVYINFSTSGISTTIGFPGASVNFNSHGTFLNTGIPGTGFYDRQRIGGTKGETNASQHDYVQSGPFNNDDLEHIYSDKAELTTSSNLHDLKKNLLDCQKERIEIKKEIKKARFYLFLSTSWLATSYITLIGFFTKWFKEVRKADREYLEDLIKQLENCFIDIDMNLEKAIDEKYQELITSYMNILSSSQIWDVTASKSIDQRTTRSHANMAIVRKPVKFGFGNTEIIRSKYNALHFENANGGDLYIYPVFIAIFDSKDNFGLVDIRDLSFIFEPHGFLESGALPNDAFIDHYTWAKVNRDGSPDRRFKENYQIPVCLYGHIIMSSGTGLNEAYLLSSYEKSELFANAMREYQRTFQPLINRIQPSDNELV